MQHSTGLYTRLKNLETPDDIAKWIKDTKNNYPSKENIEKIKVQKTEDTKSRFNNRPKNSNFSINKVIFNR
jgi:Nuclear fragile X mental retardation-interacting protein 1 (NUFIP1)